MISTHRAAKKISSRVFLAAGVQAIDIGIGI
jgi:hypothetical protein